MSKQLQFESKEAFRTWLKVNCLSSEGIWMILGKHGGPKTLTANEALEEALCFGWIDGQIKRIDDKTYMKYFAQRRKNSNWSEKNIKLADKLEAAGRMTEYGRSKIEEAKQNNHLQAKEPIKNEDDHIHRFMELIKETEPAYTNYMAMSPSVKRTYSM